MLAKKPNRSYLPLFVTNLDRLIDAPEANQDQIKTACEMIERYFKTDHTFYVRPLQIVVTSKNPQAAKVTVEEILGAEGAYRADHMKVDDELGDLVEDNQIVVLDILDEDYRIDSPYMAGKEGVLIWMMQPGEAADSIDADFRIDVKDLSSSEARQKLKRATRLPFSVVDRLLESKKDPWQIGELLQLLIISHEPEELDFIGNLVRVPLCSFDWVETLEDEKYDQEDDLGEDDEDAFEMDEDNAEDESAAASQNESSTSDKR